MGNGEYVTWSQYDKHLEETKDGYERLSRVEAEVLGDGQSQRPSLRVELSGKIDKTNKLITRIGYPILIALVVRLVMDWFHIGQ